MTVTNNIKPRNYAALSPLMKKGGAHEKSKSAQRQNQKDQTRSLLDNWREDLEFERSVTDSD